MVRQGWERVLPVWPGLRNGGDGNIYQTPSSNKWQIFQEARKGLQVAKSPLPMKNYLHANTPQMPNTSMTAPFYLRKESATTYTKSAFLMGVLQLFHLPKEQGIGYKVLFLGQPSHSSAFSAPLVTVTMSRILKSSNVLFLNCIQEKQSTLMSSKQQVIYCPNIKSELSAK